MAFRSRLAILRLKRRTPSNPGVKPPESFYRSPIFRAEREDFMRMNNITSAELRAYTTPQGQVPDRLATRNLQSLLNQNGYKLKVDGIYGPVTDSAYRDLLTKRPELQQQRLDQMYAGFEQKRTAENQKVLNEAAASRLELKRIADEFNKSAPSSRQAKQTIKQLREMAADPVRFDNKTVVDALRDIKRAQAQAAEAAKRKPKSFFQQLAAGFTGNPISRGILTAISYPQEQIAQAYYSGKRAQLQGASDFQEARAAVAGLPGLGFLAGSGKLRRAVEDVNSYEERAALTDAGELASFGEFVSGRARDKLRPDLAKNLPSFQLPSPVRGVASAGLDLGFQIGTDPLTAIATGAGALARVGEVAGEAGLRAAGRQAGLSAAARKSRIARTLGDPAAQAAGQAGRAAYLSNSRTGRALLDKATEALSKNQDVRTLRKAIKNLPSEVAVVALRAARTGGVDAGRDVLARAFVEGTWNPVVKLNRQARVGLSGNVGAAIRPSPRGENLRRFVRGTDPSAGLAFKDPQKRLAFAVESSLRQAGEFGPDYYARAVKPAVAGLGIRRRLNRVEKLANDLNLGQFSDDI